MSMKRIATGFLSILLLALTFLIPLTVNATAVECSNVEKGNGLKCFGNKTIYPISIKDSTGYDLTISKKPEKIVSVTLATDEILLSLVDVSNIKALTYLSDDPGISNVANIAKSVPIKVKGNADEIINLAPDLVFVADWHSQEFIQQLRNAKLNVFVTRTPSTIDEVRKNLTIISYIVGENKNGFKVIKKMDDKLKEIEKKISKLTEAEKLTVLQYTPIESTSGKGTSFEEVVTKAGLINLPSKAGMEGWPQITREQIAALNPDVIILPSVDYYTGQNPQEFAESVKNDPLLANVKAVKNNMVIMLPEPHMACVSQYMIFGIEDTAKAAYPQLFK